MRQYQFQNLIVGGPLVSFVADSVDPHPLLFSTKFAMKLTRKAKRGTTQLFLVVSFVIILLVLPCPAFD